MIRMVAEKIAVVAHRVLADDQFRAVLADHLDQLAPDLVGSPELTIRVAQEDHLLNPENVCRLTLLFLSHRRQLTLFDGEVGGTGRPIRTDDVVDLDSPVRPEGNRPSGAELSVVRVSHHN